MAESIPAGRPTDWDRRKPVVCSLCRAAKVKPSQRSRERWLILAPDRHGEFSPHRSWIWTNLRWSNRVAPPICDRIDLDGSESRTTSKLVIQGITHYLASKSFRLATIFYVPLKAFFYPNEFALHSKWPFQEQSYQFPFSKYYSIFSFPSDVIIQVQGSYINSFHLATVFSTFNCSSAECYTGEKITPRTRIFQR